MMRKHFARLQYKNKTSGFVPEVLTIIEFYYFYFYCESSPATC